MGRGGGSYYRQVCDLGQSHCEVPTVPVQEAPKIAVDIFHPVLVQIVVEIGFVESGLKSNDIEDWVPEVGRAQGPDDSLDVGGFYARGLEVIIFKKVDVVAVLEVLEVLLCEGNQVVCCRPEECFWLVEVDEAEYDQLFQRFGCIDYGAASCRGEQQ